MLRRIENPGKFEGGLVIDEHVYSISLNGCGETVGDDHGGQSYTAVEGPFDAPEDATDEERAFLASKAGAILHESSQGFVEVTYYATHKAFDAAWARCEDAFATDDDDSE